MTTPGESAPRIARAFDRWAALYDGMATLTFAGRIHASQVALLPRLPRTGRALVVGGGSGRFLMELLDGGHAEWALSIDASAAMTRRARRRLAGRGLLPRVEFRVGGLETLRAGESFDLVATHCFLDLFDDRELRGVVERLGRTLGPGGLWLFSDFAVAPSGPARVAHGAVVAGLYACFHAAGAVGTRRLPDFEAAFREAGFHARERASRALGLLRASLFVRAGAQPNDGSSAVGP